jgi:hypothetical protein
MEPQNALGDIIEAAIAQWPEIKELPEDCVVQSPGWSKRRYVFFHFEDYWIQLSAGPNGFLAWISWDNLQDGLNAEGNTPAEAIASLKEAISGHAKAIALVQPVE